MHNAKLGPLPVLALLGDSSDSRAAKKLLMAIVGSSNPLIPPALAPDKVLH